MRENISWLKESKQQTMLLEAAFHVLNQGNGVEEFTLALGTLLDPSLVPVLFASFDAVDIVLQAGYDFGPVPVAGELFLTSTTVDLAIKLGVVDDRQEDRIGHPFGFLGQKGAFVGRTTGILVYSQALLVQELETANITLFDLSFRPILGAIIDAVDIVSRCWNLFEPFRRVVAGKRFVTTLAIDVEGKIFDHV